MPRRNCAPRGLTRLGGKEHPGYVGNGQRSFRVNSIARAVDPPLAAAAMPSSNGSLSAGSSCCNARSKGDFWNFSGGGSLLSSRSIEGSSAITRHVTRHRYDQGGKKRANGGEMSWGVPKGFAFELKVKSMCAGLSRRFPTARPEACGKIALPGLVSLSLLTCACFVSHANAASTSAGKSPTPRGHALPGWFLPFVAKQRLSATGRIRPGPGRFDAARDGDR